MQDPYRRLAVFVDNASQKHYVWVILESSDDPAVWLDLETGDAAYGTWIEAHDAGNAALLAYVDDQSQGPMRLSDLDDERPTEY